MAIPIPEGRVRLVKVALFLAALAPFGWLLRQALAGDLGANPVETLVHFTGVWTLRLLLLTLAVTPLRRVTGWGWLLRLRRMLGLFVFFYASLHLTAYLVLDQALDWGEIVADIAMRPYITVGFAAFLLLVPLAVTSTRGWVRRLGRRWQRLHRAVYAIGILGVLHFLWLVKADLREPLIYGAILAVLLAWRLPWARLAVRSAGRGQVASGQGVGARGPERAPRLQPGA
jgi:sulfoxide reductase heme-binding subunit YedZ